MKFIRYDASVQSSMIKRRMDRSFASGMPQRFFLFVFRFAGFLVAFLAAGLAYSFIPEISITTTGSSPITQAS